MKSSSQETLYIGNYNVHPEEFFGSLFWVFQHNPDMINSHSLQRRISGVSINFYYGSRLNPGVCPCFPLLISPPDGTKPECLRVLLFFHRSQWRISPVSSFCFHDLFCLFPYHPEEHHPSRQCPSTNIPRLYMPKLLESCAQYAIYYHIFLYPEAVSLPAWQYRFCCAPS